MLDCCYFYRTESKVAHFQDSTSVSSSSSMIKRIAWIVLTVILGNLPQICIDLCFCWEERADWRSRIQAADCSCPLSSCYKVKNYTLSAVRFWELRNYLIFLASLHHLSKRQFQKQFTFCFAQGLFWEKFLWCLTIIFSSLLFQFLHNLLI